MRDWNVGADVFSVGEEMKKKKMSQNGIITSIVVPVVIAMILSVWDDAKNLIVDTVKFVDDYPATKSEIKTQHDLLISMKTELDILQEVNKVTVVDRETGAYKISGSNKVLSLPTTPDILLKSEYIDTFPIVKRHHRPFGIFRKHMAVNVDTVKVDSMGNKIIGR